MCIKCCHLKKKNVFSIFVAAQFIEKKGKIINITRAIGYYKRIWGTLYVCVSARQCLCKYVKCVFMVVRMSV